MKVSRYRKDDPVSYLLGATVVMEYLLNKPGSVKGVILHPKFNAADTIAKIEEITSGYGIPLTVEEKPFNILSQKENCFVIGVIAKSEDKIKDGNHVVLVNPSNAGNLGTIIRSQIGFDVTDLAIILPAVDVYDPKTIRASMGALSRIRVETFASFDDYRARFPGNNYYPFMLDGSVRLQDTEIKEPFSLIMGNEATGLPADFSKIGQPIRIEHTGGIDSLNLPIATGIGLYHATKARFSGK